MDAKKSTTKLPEESQDSGVFSGPLDRFGDSDSFGSSGLSKEAILSCQTGDSGVVLLSECLEDLGVTEKDLAKTTLTVEDILPKQEAPDADPLMDPFIQDDDGDTYLHIAAVHGCEQSVCTLINICPNRDWFNVPNDDGQTALHLSVLSRNATVTRMLVLAGASISVRDRLGETPLHKAAKLNDVKCIHALLTPVGEYPQRITPVLEQKNYNGQACVHLAAAAGHIDTLQTLVAYYKADINLRENLAGWTPLHIAARNGNESLVRYLCEKCPGVQVQAWDYARRTPRNLAKLSGVSDVFPAESDDSDSDTDYDSDGDNLFERLLSHPSSLIDVK